MEFTPINNIKLRKCINCNFTCSKNIDWERHINTAKHNNRTKLNILEQNTPIYTKCLFTCKKCNKEYNARNSLWYHEKKCNYVQICPENIKNDLLHKDKFSDKELIMLLIKENSEFKQMMIDQQTMMMKVIENTATNTTNNTNTNCNNTNNKFNLNLFLNETCKDAMNMSDFLNQLQLTTKDLELTGQDGFAVGIGHSFVQGIKALEVNKRPLHCSDIKREIFYIKEDNIWEKEDEKRGKLIKAIQKIAHKNILNIPAWKAEHPYCRDQHHKDNDKFLQIMIESMTGKDDPNIIQEYDKIIRNVAKEVLINKS